MESDFSPVGRPMGRPTLDHRRLVEVRPMSAEQRVERRPSFGRPRHVGERNRHAVFDGKAATKAFPPMAPGREQDS